MQNELLEFIELSKTITQSKWGVNHQGCLCIELERDVGGRNAAFIVRARNISPTMAECLLQALTATQKNVQFVRDEQDEALALAMEGQLQQILDTWEAAA